jgi:hypothetical protein
MEALILLPFVGDSCCGCGPSWTRLGFGCGVACGRSEQDDVVASHIRPAVLRDALLPLMDPAKARDVRAERSSLTSRFIAGALRRKGRVANWSHHG